MTIEKAEKIGDGVLDWCIKEYGHSKYRKECPLLLAEYDGPVPGADYGEYEFDENVIIVYTRTCRTVPVLIRTIIHEYYHYLQSPIWLTRHRKKYRYRNHPYEIQSTEKEKDWRKCFRYLKKRKLT